MSTEPRTSVDALLGRLDRVRTLARRLVRDAAEADDLVQEAVATALGRPTPVTDVGDGWITATLRNIQRDRARSEGSRGRRERAAARPEGAGRDTRVLVENAERQRDVVEAVLALDEPYRETLLLRFFEDLPPRAIVKRTGRSPETVKKHLDRGLAKLRRKLEARYGDRGAWAVALLPVAGSDVLKGTAAAGVGGASAASLARAALVLVVATAVCVPIILLARDATRGTGAPPVEVARLSPVGSGPALVDVGERSEGRGVEAEDHAAGHGDHGGDDPEAAAVTGGLPTIERTCRLLGLDGAPIADARVEWPWSPPAEVGGPRPIATGTTDDRGSITLAGPTYPDWDAAVWTVDGARRAVVGEVADPERRTLVLAPAVSVAGRCVDGTGAPVAGVELTAWSSLTSLPAFPASFEFTHANRQVKRTTDALGGFTFDAIATHPSFLIYLDSEGRYGSTVQVPAVDTFDLEVVVGDELPPRRWMTGTVVEEGGEPVPEAEVMFRFHSATTDARGRFRIEAPDDPEGDLIAASAEDGRYAVAPGPVGLDDLDSGETLEDAVVLRIPAKMSSIRGRLVDADGAAVPAWSVYVYDGTRVGGTTGMYEAGGSYEPLRTDLEGRFEVPFCSDRPYRLRFVDQRTMSVKDAGPIEPGGGEHVVQLPRDLLVDELRGRVSDLFGDPVVGVRVSLYAPLNDPADSIVMGTGGRETTTDANGAFVLSDAPWRHVSVSIQPRPGSGSRSVTVPIGDERPEEPLELEVDLQCRVLATLADPAASRVEAFDAAGERLRVRIFEAGMTTVRRSVPRSDDGTVPSFDVSQRATELVVRDADGVELERRPVRLSPTEVNDVVF